MKIKPALLEELRIMTDHYNDEDDGSIGDEKEVAARKNVYEFLREDNVELTEDGAALLKLDLLDLDGSDYLAENPNLRNQWKEAVIDLGLTNEMTVDERNNTFVSGGKNYWFKHKGKYYSN